MGFLWDVYNSMDHEKFSENKKYNSKIILPELYPMDTIGYGEKKKRNIIGNCETSSQF